VLKLLQELEHEGHIETRLEIPETRRIVQEILNRIEKEGITSIEVPSRELRSRVRSILEKYFGYIVEEVDNILTIVHKTRQHELEQLVKNALQQEETSPSPIQTGLSTL